MGPNPNEVSRRVAEATCHPLYDLSTNDNDVCLLKLSAPVSFTDYISPVCLAAANSTVLSGTRSWITGWGKAGDGKLSPGKPHAPFQPQVATSNVSCGNQDVSQTSSRRWRCPSWETTSAGAPTLKSLTTWCVPGTRLGGRIPARWVFYGGTRPKQEGPHFFLRISTGRLRRPPGDRRDRDGLGPGWACELWTRLRPAQHSWGLRPRVPVPGLDPRRHWQQSAGLRCLKLVWN